MSKPKEVEKIAQKRIMEPFCYFFGLRNTETKLMIIQCSYFNY